MWYLQMFCTSLFKLKELLKVLDFSSKKKDCTVPRSVDVRMINEYSAIAKSHTMSCDDLNTAVRVYSPYVLQESRSSSYIRI